MKKEPENPPQTLLEGIIREKEEEAAGGACELPDHRGPRWPLTLIMTLEVAI